ncbi:MAG: leucine-rich repeat domain-containing protein [Ruminococcaceae bacterium]|nr:leucine-rich repeat domain-containing protein [Oscillospiraceae bacterium]
MNYSSLYKYEKCANGLSLKKFLAASDSSVTDIVIPSEHSGVPVTEIGFEAFARSRFIRSLVIPESVLKLGGGAFRECTSLESVRVSGSIRQLPAAAFFGCSALKSAELCEGIEVIGSNAFRKCISLESIVLPKSLRSIESCAFLESPRLPAEVVMIGLAGSIDHTKPFKHYIEFDWENALRPDVFSLALQYGSYDNNRDLVLLQIVKRDLTEYLELVERAGWLDNMDEGYIERMILIAASLRKAEAAAWLLDCKKRRFGFGGRNYEL